MDPNAVLQKLRENVAEFLRRDDAEVVNAADMYAIAALVVEAAGDLDDWLSKGGFLPSDWAR